MTNIRLKSGVVYLILLKSSLVDLFGFQALGLKFVFECAHADFTANDVFFGII